MGIRFYVRLAACCTLGATLAVRHVYWYEPAFWVIMFAVIAFAIGFKDA